MGVIFYFGPSRKHFLQMDPLGKRFSYLEPSTGRQDGWNPKCKVGRHGQWHPILSTCKGVTPCRTQRASPLGHGTVPMRLSPCCLIPVWASLSSSSLTLSILLISLSQRAPPSTIQPSGHSCAISSQSRSSLRYPPPLYLENTPLFCLGFEKKSMNGLHEEGDIFVERNSDTCKYCSFGVCPVGLDG
jgi:hypothetical protein